MEKHVANYFKAFGYDKSSFIPCEVCSAQSVDLHHVEPRSKFGSTQKHLQDDPSNVVALCRSCHDDAHGPKSREVKEALKELVRRRNEVIHE